MKTNFVKQMKREKITHGQDMPTSLQRKQEEKARQMRRSNARMNKRNFWGE